MKKTLLPLLAAVALVATATAKDLGVQGNTWPIAEVDMRQLMLESAMRTDWSVAQNEAKDNANTYLSRLPKRRLPSPEQTRIDWMDPSIELKSDIQAPVKQADGSLAWKVIYPKGTRANPMTQFRPVTAMFLYDGSDPEQLRLVQQVLALEPDRIMPVEAGAGDLKASIDLLQRPVYYANDAIIARFQVRYLPTFIYPGDGEHSLHMAIHAYAPPYKAAEVVGSWRDLRPAVSATPQRTAQ